MRILFIPAAGGVGLGPLTNVLAIAEASVSAGHEIAFVCKGPWMSFIKNLGHEVYSAPLPNPFKGILPPPYKLSDVLIGLGWAEEDFIRASIRSEIEAINSFSADIVVSMLQVTAPISATITGKPSASIFSWADGPDFLSPLYKSEETSSGWEQNYNRVFKEFGIAPIQDICELAFVRSELKIAPTIPELQPELTQVSNVHFVGNLLSHSMELGVLPEKITKLKERHLIIFVYLSPGDIKPDVWIPTLIEAFTGSDYQVMITLAPLDISLDSLPASKNIHFFERLPGSTAIANADLVISHGGANTVMNALIHGVPQIVFPDEYAERDYNGRAVEKLGAGMNLATEHFNPKSILSYVDHIFSNDRFKHNAGKIAEIIKSYDGGKRVVELMELEVLNHSV